VSPDLIEAIRNHEEWAFRELIRENQGKVYNVCLTMLKNLEDAEDLSQEVFIDVFEKVEQFRGQAEISTWLYKLAVNKSLEFLRKQKRQKRWNGLKALVLGTEEINHPKDFDHPGVIMENQEHARVLFKHIERLSDKQKVAFTLNKTEGLAYLQIAEIMEVSVSSVESLIFRANSNLRKSLKSYYESIKD